MKARVSADTKATNIMVMLLHTRDQEKHLFVPKREVEIKGKEWRKVDREGSRDSQLGAAWATWSFKKITGCGMDGRIVENRTMTLNCLHAIAYCDLSFPHLQLSSALTSSLWLLRKKKKKVLWPASGSM